MKTEYQWFCYLKGFGWFASDIIRNKSKAVASLKRYKKKHPDVETFLEKRVCTIIAEPQKYDKNR
jgi:N12 class adenine-specific DNA methylase